MKLQLGILDVGLMNKGTSALDVINETLMLSQELDALGFSRFWLGEHHESNIAWRNPDILIPLIATRTQRILVGSAGVLMRYYEPAFVANSYRTLALLFGQRIELGFSKGSLPPELHTTFIKQFPSTPASIDDKCLEVKHLLAGGPSDQFKNNRSPLSPNLWILGGSPASINFAVEHGFNCSISFCHSKRSRKELDEIRRCLKGNQSKILDKGLLFNILLDIICTDVGGKLKIVPEQSNVNFIGSTKEVAGFLNQVSDYFGIREFIIRKDYSHPETVIEQCTSLSRTMLK